MTDTNGQDGGDRLWTPTPEEIEQLAHAIPEPEFDAAGRVVRLLVTPKDFLPPGVLPDQIIGGQPEGTTVNLGTIAGEVRSVDLHKHEWQGKLLESWWLNGYFQAVNLTTGEVFNAPCCALPKAYGVQVATAFQQAGVRMAALGVTVGLIKKRRGGVAYEWFVRDHYTPVNQARVAKASAKITQAVLAGEGSPLKQISGNFDADGKLTASR